MKPNRIITVGDLFLGGSLSSNEASRVSELLGADHSYVIANLEQPLTRHPAAKATSSLHTGPDNVALLREMGIDAVNLANNHIHDCGPAGLKETIDVLDEAGIGHFGAGVTEEEARAPLLVNGRIAILGYCDYDKPYLKNVLVSTDKTPGVNGLRLERILEDLNRLDENQRALLYFHWGREHSNFPEHSDIVLGTKLLRDRRVAGIVGMHSHRAQGSLCVDGKLAYASLGNFLFPEFVITPPSLYAPSVKESVRYTTSAYHRVFAPTLKTWPASNRTSLMVEWDTEGNHLGSAILRQGRGSVPSLRALHGVKRAFHAIRLYCLSRAYIFPAPLYRCISRFANGVDTRAYSLRCRAQQLKQLEDILSSSRGGQLGNIYGYFQRARVTVREAIKPIWCKRRVLFEYPSLLPASASTPFKFEVHQGDPATLAARGGLTAQLAALCEKRQNSGWLVYWVEIDGGVVAYSFLHTPSETTWHDSLPTHPGEARETTTFVEDRWRGKKLRASLLQAQTIYCRDAGLRHWAVVETSNVASLRSSEAFGAKRAGVNILVKTFGVNIMSLVMGRENHSWLLFGNKRNRL